MQKDGTPSGLDEHDFDFLQLEGLLHHSIDRSDSPDGSADMTPFNASSEGNYTELTFFPIDYSSISSPSTSLYSWGSCSHAVLASDLFMDQPLTPRPDSLVAYHIDRAGQTLLLEHFPENHRIIRPDDSVHINLLSRTSFLLLLSGTNDEPRVVGSLHHSRWLGQFNGRGNFKATLAEHSQFQESPVYVLSACAGPICVDFRTEISTLVLCLDGQLAIQIEANEPTHLIFSIPAGTPVMCSFEIQVVLDPICRDIVNDTLLQPAPATSVQLEDCRESMKFTTRYPIRSRGKARKSVAGSHSRSEHKRA